MGLLVAISICHTICWRTTVLQPTFTVLRCLAFALLKVQFQNFSTLQSQQSPLLLWRVVPLLRGVHSCWVYQAKAETELNSFLNQNLVPQSCLQWVDSKDKISNAIKKKKKSTQETNTTSYLSNINHWFPLFTTRTNYAMPRATEHCLTKLPFV